MNYTVVWEPSAENDLTRAWLAAPDQLAVTQAAHRLDQELEVRPFAIGIPRGSPVNRSAVDPPLGIDYEIIEDDKKVRVLRAWLI